MKWTLREPRVVPARHERDGYLAGACEWNGREVSAFAVPVACLSDEQLSALAKSTVEVNCDAPAFAEGVGLLLLRCEFNS